MVSTNWRGYRIAAWGGQCLLTIAVLVTASQGKWKEAIALAIFLLASFAFVALENHLPTLFDMLFVLAALLNIDLVMDTLGAGMAALLSLWALQDWVRPNSMATNQQAEVYNRSHRE